MVVIRELPVRVADEFIAVEVCRQRRMQQAVGNQIAEIGKARREQIEGLAQRRRLELEVGHTGAFARNTEEFDMHAGRKLMIALAVTAPWADLKVGLYE